MYCFALSSARELLGWVLLCRTESPLIGHWGTVERLQAHPDARGRGIGRALLTELEHYARNELQLEQLHLAARGGMGLEDYYQHLGWSEIGRWPRVLRFAEHDERDEILMLRRLTQCPLMSPDVPSAPQTVTVIWETHH